MKTIGTKFLAIAATGLMAVSLNSCKKEVPVEPKKTTGISSMATAAQSMQNMGTAFNYTLRVMDALESKNFNLKNDELSELTTCAVVTIDSVSNPHTCTLDFGTGCDNDQGEIRKGLIHIEYNGDNFKSPGTYVHVTFDNFAIDSINFNGTFNVSNNGYNGDGKLNFSLAANIVAENTNDGATINGQAAVDVVWAAGSDTKTKEDDLMDFSGGIQASASSGQTIAVDIMSTLSLNRSEACDGQFTSGEIRAQQSGHSDKYLDFGSGDCDGIATETIDGNSQQVSLDNYELFQPE